MYKNMGEPAIRKYQPCQMLSPKIGDDQDRFPFKRETHQVNTSIRGMTCDTEHKRTD